MEPRTHSGDEIAWIEWYFYRGSIWFESLLCTFKNCTKCIKLSFDSDCTKCIQKFQKLHKTYRTVARFRSFLRIGKGLLFFNLMWSRLDGIIWQISARSTVDDGLLWECRPIFVCSSRPNLTICSLNYISPNRCRNFCIFLNTIAIPFSPFASSPKIKVEPCCLR